MKRAIVISVIMIMLLIPAECFAKVDSDKNLSGTFYVYGGSGCKATCVIDETVMPYYEATELKAKDVNRYKEKAKKWLKKNTKKAKTYKITFKKKSGKKWVSASGYTLKKKFNRKIRIRSRKNGNKSYVYATVSYTGKDETFYKTKKFKKNTMYIENSSENEAFYFDSRGRFHWEPGEDDDES